MVSHGSVESENEAGTCKVVIDPGIENFKEANVHEAKLVQGEHNVLSLLTSVLRSLVLNDLLVEPIVRAVLGKSYDVHYLHNDIPTPGNDALLNIGEVRNVAVEVFILEDIVMAILYVTEVHLQNIILGDGMGNPGAILDIVD